VLGQKDSSDPSMARITQTFQSIIQGGVSHQLGKSCFLLTTSNNEDMDQPWQKRFQNRIHVKPPNAENLARFVKLMWAKTETEFLNECQDQSDLDVSELLEKLVLHQTGPRDIEEILSEMWRLLDTRNLREGKYLAENNDVDDDDLSVALGDLSEAVSCTTFFRMACNNILFEPKSIQSVSLSAVPAPVQDPYMEEFIEKHLGFQDSNTDESDIRYLKRSTLNSYLRSGGFDANLDGRSVANAVNRKSNFHVPYSRKVWVSKANPLHETSTTITGWKGVYLRNLEDDNADGGIEVMEE
jgi:hypothetical protein